MATIFTLDMFKTLGVCSGGLARVKRHGSTIANTAEGWNTYIDAYPDAWRAPLFTAWRLRRDGWNIDPDLVWKIARIAFREAGKRYQTLAQYAETLNDNNWREARDAAYAAYAADAAYAAYAAYAAVAADAAYAAYAAVAADAAYAAYAAARNQVRREIANLAIAALIAADPS